MNADACLACGISDNDACGCCIASDDIIVAPVRRLLLPQIDPNEAERALEPELPGVRQLELLPVKEWRRISQRPPARVFIAVWYWRRLRRWVARNIRDLLTLLAGLAVMGAGYLMIVALAVM